MKNPFINMNIMTNLVLDGLTTIRRRYARMKNTNSAVKKMKDSKNPSVSAILKKFDGTPKELLKKIKGIKKGVSSKDALNDILGVEFAEESTDSVVNIDDDPYVNIVAPANIECDPPKEKNLESIVVINSDGLTGCATIDKKYLNPQ